MGPCQDVVVQNGAEPNSAVEACVADSNSTVQHLQSRCKDLQAQLVTMEAAHAADMDAMTEQLADSASALAAKGAVVRCVLSLSSSSSAPWPTDIPRGMPCEPYLY